MAQAQAHGRNQPVAMVYLFSSCLQVLIGHRCQDIRRKVLTGDRFMQENVFGLARLLLLELYVIVCDLSFLQSFVHEGCQEFWGCLYGIAI